MEPILSTILQFSSKSPSSKNAKSALVLALDEEARLKTLQTLVKIKRTLKITSETQGDNTKKCYFQSKKKSFKEYMEEAKQFREVDQGLRELQRLQEIKRANQYKINRLQGTKKAPQIPVKTQAKGFSKLENQKLLMEILDIFKAHNVCKQKRRLGSRKHSRRYYRGFDLLEPQSPLNMNTDSLKDLLINILYETSTASKPSLRPVQLPIKIFQPLYESSGSPLNTSKLNYSSEDLQMIIEVILGDNELKEFFHDLIADKGVGGVSEGMEMTKPVSETRVKTTKKNNSTKNKFCLKFQNERLLSSSGFRKCGQTSYSLFSQQSRAGTASISAIRKRRRERLDHTRKDFKKQPAFEEKKKKNVKSTLRDGKLMIKRGRFRGRSQAL
ncbi:unnamed protein product [Moneuplotes crassus]|uniref:Uncharacterized protein n=1 Tax=Euplotes crassus TaxID=5936 RepID=A0AAD1XYX3_EUPCR|nr:unnamed protein product [Moneuplotes crassus]